MREEPVHIQWYYRGKPDYNFGPGATLAERGLAMLAMLAGAGVYAYLYLNAAYPWQVWQYALGAFFGLDVAGGIVAFSLNSNKRFYHGPIQKTDSAVARGLKQPVFFAALHAHPLLVGLFYPGGQWATGLGGYLALLAGAGLVSSAPLYLRRPVAMVLVVFALLSGYLAAPVPGFEWLLPGLFLKIVYGHAVREEPYRPAD